MSINFNPQPPFWMHIDLNSCFATIEQQANPYLRGRPIAVAAYTTPRGCILAPSVEAKKYGVKTGMRVFEGKNLCPSLMVLPADPPKYRFVNHQLTTLLNQYSPDISVRSIDEVLTNFTHLPIDKRNSLIDTGREIKQRIKNEIGEWLTVSVGISTNPYLAKVAAGLHKPDGLDVITQANILSVLSKLKLTDLPYIKERNALRLNRYRVYTPVDFYTATPQTLKSAFSGISGDYWYLRLHGFSVDEVEWQRRTIGHSYALPKATNDLNDLNKLLCKLVEKVGRRLRRHQLTTQGVHLACNFVDGSFWHKSKKLPAKVYLSSDLFLSFQQLLTLIKPLKPVRILAVSAFNLNNDLYQQQSLFQDEDKRRKIVQALDHINDRWGEFSVVPATILGMNNMIVDRIAFGKSSV